MKENLSERINNLAVSQTLAMAAKARELKNEGKDVIGLSLGEPEDYLGSSRFSIRKI